MNGSAPHAGSDIVSALTALHDESVACSMRVLAGPSGRSTPGKLPHPLLGSITVREMLFFTLYHNQHHLDGVRRRVGAAGPGTSQPAQQAKTGP